MYSLSFSKKTFLSVIIGASLFLSFTSLLKANPDDIYIGSSSVIPVNLYATNEYGSLIQDPNNPGQYQLNQFNIDLAGVSDDSITFGIEPVGTSDIKVTLGKTLWTISLASQDPNAASAIYYSTSARVPDPNTGLINLRCTFTASQAGPQPIRVTSSKNPNFTGEITDGSDQVAYTMTIVVVDNSPKKPTPPTDQPADNASTDTQPAPAN